jgi:ABC-type uncharacterized transport system permease subunit
MALEGISRFCFGASYAVALGSELARVYWPQWAPRWIGLLFGCAGLFAHTLYLFFHRPSPAGAAGALWVLAWVLAVYYVYSSVQYRKFTLALFVLPMMLGLLALAELNVDSVAQPLGGAFWPSVHGGLILLAGMGLTIGFLASVMYLVQAWRLGHKLAPHQGPRLFSLERLETMNRRAIHWSFPLLTAGLLVGALLWPRSDMSELATPKILTTAGLWLTFLAVLYLRHAVHLLPRRLAWLTVAAFALLLFSLVAAHPFAGTVGE